MTKRWNLEPEGRHAGREWRTTRRGFHRRPANGRWREGGDSWEGEKGSCRTARHVLPDLAAPYRPFFGRGGLAGRLKEVSAPLPRGDPKRRPCIRFFPKPENKEVTGAKARLSVPGSSGPSIHPATRACLVCRSAIVLACRNRPMRVSFARGGLRRAGYRLSYGRGGATGRRNEASAPFPRARPIVVPASVFPNPASRALSGVVARKSPPRPSEASPPRRCAIDRDNEDHIENVETRSHAFHGYFSAKQMARSARHICEPVAAAGNVQPMHELAIIPVENAGDGMAGASGHSASPRKAGAVRPRVASLLIPW